MKKTLAVQALPTFLVLDPNTGKVLIRWVGGATLPQFQRLLEDGLLAFDGRAGKGSPADQALVRADGLYGQADYAGAAAAYREALAAAPAEWPRYGRSVESLLFSLQTTEKFEDAAKLAREAFPRLRRTVSAANLAATGLDCALSLPPDHPDRRELADTLEAWTREVAADTTLEMAADDRSGVYIGLLTARQEAKDSVGAHAVAEQWADFLESAAVKARTPEERAVFDSHRMSAYGELGRYERAIPMLQASERDLPGDYNPPARLSVVYRNLKSWDEALAASDRALKLAYGPRKLGMLSNRAEIYVGMADTSAAVKTLNDALGEAAALPADQQPARTVAAFKKRIQTLQGGSAAPAK
ncbi:MAG: thiol reductase thioredoxin [Candidatus Eisenbacteria bacterium]|nr:thiol reductase thioredoxin [Candidatus Eisenbacteria bacterium]